MWRLNFKKHRKIFPLLIGLCLLFSAVAAQAQAIDNLKKYCEELARTGAVHPYQVQLGRGKEAYAA